MRRKVLLVEDDPSKASKISNYIKSKFDIDIIHMASYKSAVHRILNDLFDFIILDMSIPTYDSNEGAFSGKPKSFGGKNILKEMKRYRRFSSVIVITQYNEFDGGVISLEKLDEELRTKYSDNYRGYILYKNTGGDWDKKLHEFITLNV